LIRWPAYSPDLNPIENVWGIMVQALAGMDFDTREEFQKAISKAWDDVPLSVLRSLLDKMNSRYEAVIAAKGYPTKY